MRLSGATVVATLSQIVKSKLGAVLLGTAGMGTFNQLKNVWNLLQVLANAGFYNGVVTRIAELNSDPKPDQLRLQIATTSIFLGIFSCVFAAGSFLASPWISALVFDGSSQYAPHIAVISLSIPFAVFARIYKAILAGMQEVPGIVRAQVTADLSSLAVFAVLVYLGRLWGAVLAFSIYHTLRAACGFYYARKAVGPGVLSLAVEYFSRDELKHNIRFGVNSFIITPASIITTLIAARWIIETGGMEANGVFAAAWMVSSVYLRTIHETASSYFLPSLTSAEDDNEMFTCISSAIRLYSMLLTPCIIGLVTLGPIMITLLFSREFSGAGRLLLFLLPGDLLRITSESIGMSYLAKKHLTVYTASYFVWVTLYLGLAAWLVTDCSSEGVAIAYLCGHIIYAIFHVVAARILVGFQPDSATRTTVLCCFLLCLSTSTVVAFDGSLLTRAATLIVGGLLWGAVAAKDSEVIGLLAAMKRRILQK